MHIVRIGEVRNERNIARHRGIEVVRLPVKIPGIELLPRRGNGSMLGLLCLLIVRDLLRLDNLARSILEQNDPFVAEFGNKLDIGHNGRGEIKAIGRQRTVLHLLIPTEKRNVTCRNDRRRRLGAHFALYHVFRNGIVSFSSERDRMQRSAHRIDGKNGRQMAQRRPSSIGNLLNVCYIALGVIQRRGPGLQISVRQRQGNVAFRLDLIPRGVEQRHIHGDKADQLLSFGRSFLLGNLANVLAPKRNDLHGNARREHASGRLQRDRGRTDRLGERNSRSIGIPSRINLRVAGNRRGLGRRRRLLGLHGLGVHGNHQRAVHVLGGNGVAAVNLLNRYVLARGVACNNLGNPVARIGRSGELQLFVQLGCKRLGIKNLVLHGHVGMLGLKRDHRFVNLGRNDRPGLRCGRVRSSGIGTVLHGVLNRLLILRGLNGLRRFLRRRTSRRSVGAAFGKSREIRHGQNHDNRHEHGQAFAFKRVFEIEHLL